MLQHFGRRAVVVGAFLFVQAGATAFAQTQQASATGWEVEGHGGLSLIRLPAGGTAGVPDAGAPLTSTSPIFPARRTASWFLGDGAAMINAANAELGVGARLLPLDDALSGLGRGSTSGAIFGVRLRRWVHRRVTAEVSVDVMGGSADLPDALVEAADATRESFDAAMTGLFASGPFAGTAVTTAISRAGGSSRQVALTGGVNLHLTQGDRVAPYVTIGAGIITGARDGESLTLEGRYETATALDGVPNIVIDETDRLTLRYGHATTFVAVTGAGWRQDLAGGWGVRLDARVFIGANNTRLLLDARPSVARSTPAGFIETLTYPNIQFSSDPSSGRESTLSAPAIEGFPAFRGEGVQARVLFSIGISRRF